MPARAFVDSDVTAFEPNAPVDGSKCPQGHLLILIEGATGETIPGTASKCPQGHLLILIGISLD